MITGEYDGSTYFVTGSAKSSDGDLIGEVMKKFPLPESNRYPMVRSHAFYPLN